MTFKDWMRAVDKALTAWCSMGVDDFADEAFHAEWEHGPGDLESAEDMAFRMLLEVGFPELAPQAVQERF